MTRAKFPVTNKSLGEFLDNYDRKTFHNKMEDIMMDSLYYPEDCINLVEKRAEEAYDKLGDIAKFLFEN